jgi:hypothetical protein
MRLLKLLDDTPVVPGDIRPAYEGGAQARQILNDAEDDLRDWRPDTLEEDTRDEEVKLVQKTSRDAAGYQSQGDNRLTQKTSRDTGYQPQKTSLDAGYQSQGDSMFTQPAGRLERSSYDDKDVDYVHEDAVAARPVVQGQGVSNYDEHMSGGRDAGAETGDTTRGERPPSSEGGSSLPQVAKRFLGIGS